MGSHEEFSITPGAQEPMISIDSMSDKNTASGDTVGVSGGPKKNQLNTLMGVYIPCMLSILGAILFLRLSWAVGQVGFLGVFGIFMLAGAAVLLTALSISAISTNGTMGGGGAYYMISRSIGPEFGGAVGVIFYFANAFGTTFYLVAFADNVMKTFFSDVDLWTKVLVSSIALLFTLIAAWIGADFFSKLNALILFVICISIVTAFLNLFLGSEFGCTEDSSDGVAGFTGLNHTTFVDNLTPNYGYVVDDKTNEIDFSEKNTYFGVFAIVFPAMTGIMAGANLSGDLKDPGRSIGKGTIYAIFSSLVIYLSLAFVVSWSLTTEYLKDEPQALQEISCWPSGEFFIVAGIACSTLSSALGALTGAARVLQAFSKDFSTIGRSDSRIGEFILKSLKFFSHGTPVKNEPRRAVILTWAIAQALLLLGSLDLIASIITNCFLLTYFFTNFACFVLKVSGAPNFRPRFRFFSWHTALLGAILNIVIMFLASPIFATVSILIMIFVFVLVVWSAPDVPWGDVSQALIYHQVRKYLLQLDERKAHPKFWRPSILLIVDDPVRSLGLIDFCNNLKKGGLYVIGDVLVGNLQNTGSACLRVQELWNDFIPLVDVKAFSEVIVSPSHRIGCHTLMLSAGLGGMKPNTVVIPFPTPEIRPGQITRQPSYTHVSSEVLDKLEQISSVHYDPSGLADGEAHDGAQKQGTREFVGSIRDALLLNKNLLVARNFHNLDKGLIVSKVKEMQTEESTGKKIKKSLREELTIDIWFTEELDASDLRSYSGCLSLMMQLAHGLNRTDIWQECSRLRIIHLIQEKDQEHFSEDIVFSYRTRMESLLSESRINAQSEVFIMPNTHNSSNHYEVMNNFIKSHMEKTAIIFLNLPLPPEDVDNDEAYMRDISTLTEGLHPTVLTAVGKNLQVITTEI